MEITHTSLSAAPSSLPVWSSVCRSQILCPTSDPLRPEQHSQPYPHEPNLRTISATNLPAQVARPFLHQIQYPPRRAYNNPRLCLFQLLYLVFLAHTPKYRHTTNSNFLSQLRQRFVRLDGQFPCRRNNQYRYPLGFFPHQSSQGWYPKSQRFPTVPSS